VTGYEEKAWGASDPNVEREYRDAVRALFCMGEAGD
jgi:hypothetical protein